MAYRRSIITRAKFLYQKQQFTPSFAYIHNNDDPKPKPVPEYPKSPSFTTKIDTSSLFQSHKISRLLGPSFTGGMIIMSSRKMSTSVGEGADKIGDYITDVAEVFVDGTVDAVASKAQVVSEVAVAAADSYFPVAALQYVIDYVHSFTGFHWWASIVVTTLLIRGLTVPLMINQLKATSKLTLMRPHLEEIKQEMQNRGMDPTAVAEGQQRMAELFREYGVTPWTPLKGLLFQGPVFISFFLAISNMVEKVPSFKEGGAFWFTDLTTPDSFYIFPALTALTFWITVECNMQEGMEGNPAAGTMKNVSRGFAVLTVPFTMNFPKAVFCYWVTSNLFSLVYGLVIKKPGVKKFLGVPIITVATAPSSTTDSKPAFSLFEALKKHAAAKAAAQQPPSSSMEVSKSANQLISSSAILNHRIKSLEKEVKSRNKGKKR